MKNNTIDAKLVSSQVALANTMGNDAIKAPLSAFGYDEAKMLEGKALFEDAATKHDQQKKEYGEQYAATDEFEAAMNSANKDYMIHLKIARVALRGLRGAAEALQLEDRRKKTYTGWMKQAGIFYTNALADEAIKAALGKFGIDEAKMTAGKAAVQDVADKQAAQFKEKGEAQATTVARDEALEDLLDWMGDFVAIARIALENEPQLLKMLGIVEPS